MTCPITGDATLQQTPEGIIWLQADEEIHVASELLLSDTARAQIEYRYNVGEECPYYPSTRHARLRITDTPPPKPPEET